MSHLSDMYETLRVVGDRLRAAAPETAPMLYDLALFYSPTMMSPEALAEVKEKRDAARKALRKLAGFPRGVKGGAPKLRGDILGYIWLADEAVAGSAASDAAQLVEHNAKLAAGTAP